MLRAGLAEAELLAEEVEQNLEAAQEVDTNEAKALFYKEKVVVSMDKLRKSADLAEKLTPSDQWPFPTYATLLFGV